MTSYATIDYLPDLSAANMLSAINLTLSPYTSSSSLIPWDNSATYSTIQDNALLHSTLKWQATSGATYDISSYSYFDPYLIQVYDSLGNVVAVDSESYLDSYGFDYVWDFVAPYSGTFYVSAGWNQGYASNHKYASLSIYEDINTIAAAPRHGTDQGDVISGGYGNDSLYGHGGNDVLRGDSGDDGIDGGDGIDTAVFAASRDNYVISRLDGRVVVTDLTGTDGADSLYNVERIQFSDKSVALDIDGNAGTVYRLYQAAFNRTPDLPGIGAWVKCLDTGTTMQEVAAGFYYSPEFMSAYGAAPTNAQLITRYYENVLHREPDQSGFTWWLDVLDRSVVSPIQLLIDFSESSENQAQVIGSIQNGIEYIPPLL